jgi:hypothetical protein
MRKAPMRSYVFTAGQSSAITISGLVNGSVSTGQREESHCKGEEIIPMEFG